MHRNHTPTGPDGFDRFLVIANRTVPFASPDGQVFALVPADVRPGAGNLTLPVRSRAFRDWFFGESFTQFETVPKSPAWNAIRHHLEAQAARYERTRDIVVRRRVDSRGQGGPPEKILLDLSNPQGQFVEISPAGWSVSEAPQTPFQTSRSTQSLAAPEAAPAAAPQSPLDTLRTVLNFGPPDNPGEASPSQPDWLRCLAWLLAALRPTGAFPILVLRGPSGCGKSFAARILRSLIDPNAAAFTPHPSSAHHLLALARDNWVLAFDHVSGFTPHIADALCRVTSGVGIAHREPGEHEPLQHFVRRPVLLTVTDRWNPPRDLAARCLVVTMPDLTPDTRRTECALADTLADAIPAILGALCTAISTALRNIAAAVTPTYATRHADALSWSIAALPTLEPQLRTAFDAPPPPPPVVESVCALLSATPHWTGSATQLLKLIPICQTPKGISQQLTRHTFDLLDAGIDIQFRRLPGGARIISLDASQNLQGPPQPTVPMELKPT